jgi:RNA exonuclease NGL2
LLAHAYQEVDGLEKLLPVLEKAGYAHVYMSGPKKNHGCLIAWSADKYTLQHESRCVKYDEEEIRTEGDDKARRGSSFLTKNIAALVALTSRADAQRGLVIATTHLFWHPRQVLWLSWLVIMADEVALRYNYERTRLVLRSVELA